MKLLIQRVNYAKVIFEDDTYEQINKGLLVYMSAHCEDDENDLNKAFTKLINLRLFDNEKGQAHYSIKDLNLEIMLISNFSLQADVKKGNRPSYTNSMSADNAEILYNKFLENLKKENINYASGRFQTDMKIISENDGPFNILFDTKEKR